MPETGDDDLLDELEQREVESHSKTCGCSKCFPSLILEQRAQQKERDKLMRLERRDKERPRFSDEEQEER